MNDFIYFPLYEAFFAGIGLGGTIGVTCFVLSGIVLYAFLALTESKEARS